MENSAALLSRALGQIEKTLGWGPASQWTTADFTELSERIHEKTNTLLSPTTLKRVWGRVAYDSSPSPTTLDALAQYIGVENWRAFAEQTNAVLPREQQKIEKKSASKNFWLLLPALFVLAAVAWYVVASQTTASAETVQDDTTDANQTTSLDTINPADYSFHFRPITQGLPNSVVFTYDAQAAKTDSVFIQQNWDPRRREMIDPNGHTHTSIYYLPGFYKTKLVVGQQVVKERPLLIPSNGWTVAVMRDPVPVYVPEVDAKQNGSLLITTNQLEALGVSLQPDPPTLIFSSVGDFDNIYTDDFNFSTRLRHDYKIGSAACQMTRILLLLENSVIIVPLGRPGCIAELELIASGQYFSGRDTDLSAFGAINEDWVEISVMGKGDLLSFFINDEHVFQTERTDRNRKIIGLRYEFLGVGAIDDVSISGNGQTYQENFSVGLSVN